VSAYFDNGNDGLTDAVGDTGHTDFMTPEERTSRNDELSGSYVGIGVQLDSTDSDEPRVVTVFHDSPADKAGLRTGDVILEVDGVRDHPHFLFRHVQMLEHRGLEHAVRRNHAVGGLCAGDHGAAQGQIGDAFRARASRVGRAEFLQPLRVHHERRRSVLPTPRVAEHAGAEPVDDIHLALIDELRSQPAGPLAEEGKRGAAIEDGGAARERGQKKRAVADALRPGQRHLALGACDRRKFQGRRVAQGHRCRLKSLFTECNAFANMV
jgi:hypothetical protein